MDRKGPIIRQYLADNHFRTIPDNTYEHIEEWLEWYQNEVDKFHHYTIWNGMVNTKHERYRLWDGKDHMRGLGKPSAK